MCNLYRLRTAESLSRLFDARPLLDGTALKAEIYPRYEAAVIRTEDGRRVVDAMPWGIVATLTGKSGKPVRKPITNVRNLDSPFWRPTLADPRYRCLVPFTAFAEPRPGKDPLTGRPAQWWFDVPGQEVCAFAGLWRPSEGRPRFAFLTCEPNPLVSPLHPKAMPVILQPDDYERWLAGDTAEACRLAQPFPSQLMRVG